MITDKQKILEQLENCQKEMNNFKQFEEVFKNISKLI